MSIILNGDQSHVTTPLVRNITAIGTNGSGGMRVTTSAPHFFGPADYVNVQATGSIVGSPVDGADYFVTIIDALNFDLDGTTYTSGTATGTATDLSLSPQFLAPTDGDSFSLQLSGMLSALQCLADRTQYLRYQQVNPSTLVVIGVPGTSISAVAPGVPKFITEPFQAIEDDLATIKSGTYTDTATRTIGAGGSDTFTGGAFCRIGTGGSRLIRRAAGAAPHNATLNTPFFVDIAGANEFRWDGASPVANANFLKIKESTSMVQGGLVAGDWIRFVTGPSVPTGHAYTIYREDGTTQLAEIWGAGQWVELEWDGSQWRYVSSSPWVLNGNPPPVLTYASGGPYYNDPSPTTGVVLYAANL